MSDVMLINPSSERILNNAGDRPPLGLLYLGAVMRDRGHDVRVRDMDHYSKQDLMDEVNNNPPEYAGVSVYTSPLYKESIELAQMLNGKCKTIAGGYHATSMPGTLNSFFDTVIRGEGELALPHIVENDVDGIVIGDKLDIEQIPYPARDLIDMDNYNFKQDGRPATTLMSSRGCPMDCIFCGNMNRKMRYNSDETVISEIKELKELGFRNLYFYDDAFTMNRERTLDLIYKIGIEDINYRVTTRAKSLDEELVKELADSGCSWVSLGIESGSADRLKDVNKHMTPTDNYNAIQLLHNHGIKSKGFFMFGLPNETKEDAEKTIAFSKLLRDEGLTSADFYIMTPFPGTPIWNNPENYGIQIVDRDYTKYLEAGKEPAKAFHKTKYMNTKQIEEVRKRAEEEWKQ